MSKGIQQIFSEVPETYEFVNHVLTLGMDIKWRKKAVGIAIADGGSHWLDVCTGTGETASYLSRNAGKHTTVFAADFSLPMVKQAQKKSEAEKIKFSIANIRILPFPDNSFDLITISFATRNINTSQRALIESFAEFHRILKPGGRFINLETSQPANELIKKFFHIYVKLFVKPVGTKISGSSAGYAYLSSTIPRFYPAKKLADILYRAGFKEVVYKRLMFGAAAIHKAIK